MTKLPADHCRLNEASVSQLRDWWLGVFAHAAPRRLRRDFLELVLAYEIQTQQSGGLDRVTREALSAAIAELKLSGSVTPRTLTEIRPGTRLVREWGDKRHVVTALEIGFDYRGDRFNSLSQVAAHITGVKRSGPLFFGLTGGV